MMWVTLRYRVGNDCHPHKTAKTVPAMAPTQRRIKTLRMWGPRSNSRPCPKNTASQGPSLCRIRRCIPRQCSARHPQLAEWLRQGTHKLAQPSLLQIWVTTTKMRKQMMEIRAGRWRTPTSVHSSTNWAATGQTSNHKVSSRHAQVTPSDHRNTSLAGIRPEIRVELFMFRTKRNANEHFKDIADRVRRYCKAKDYV